LEPKGSGDIVELGLDPNTFDASTVRVTDQLGNVTALSFSELKNNVAFEDSRFHFDVPKGADVVDAPAAKEQSTASTAKETGK